MTKTKPKKRQPMSNAEFLQRVNWAEVARGTREHLAECEARQSQIMLDVGARQLSTREVTEYRARERNADECRMFLYALARYLDRR
jgi:hypothetical protein